MTLQELHQLAVEYKGLQESGQISNAEYADLLRGLDMSAVIANSTEELEAKEQMNTYINAAITAASMV
jgi:hypothetical protein